VVNNEMIQYVINTPNYSRGRSRDTGSAIWWVCLEQNIGSEAQYNGSAPL